jgi:uncharacterized protein
MANKLAGEQSPYLLQHAHNPVDWYPWGDAPFALAAQLNRPVIVSIGYAACHWCHVMERESFEDPEVAAFMNQHFVCVKVDREEHPDVDHFYMDAVQAIAQSGGWPLNVFTTPQRVPFFGGTYYPPRPAYNRLSWMQLLTRILKIWQEQPEQVAQQATQMVAYLSNASKIQFQPRETEVTSDDCRLMVESLLKLADTENGGFGSAPKFPGTMATTMLLEYYHYTGYQPALDHALLTLHKMLDGGIYDQLCGGLARYATDKKWLAPHFEKMLYDNAMFISVLCDAYSITKTDRFADAVNEIIAFAERELANGAGGYYCAIDADSEGEEGKYYTWTWQEWLDAVGYDPAISAYFGVKGQGNWEGTNILTVGANIDELARQFELSAEDLRLRVQEAKEKLLQHRSRRVRPQTDDKSLLAWNALMNLALTKAATALNEPKYLARAVAHMEWMLAAYRIGDRLMHTWKNGVAKIEATLDDYAYLIQALIKLSEAHKDARWLRQAVELLDTVMSGFRDEQADYFYYSRNESKHIPARKVDVYDGVMPSANGVMAYNLRIAGMCMDRYDWIALSRKMLDGMAAGCLRHTYSFAYWALLLQRQVKGIKTVLVGGAESEDAANTLMRQYIPEIYVITSAKEISDLPISEKKDFTHNIAIFVCTEQYCLEPLGSIEEMLLFFEK